MADITANGIPAAEVYRAERDGVVVMVYPSGTYALVPPAEAERSAAE